LIRCRETERRAEDCPPHRSRRRHGRAVTPCARRRPTYSPWRGHRTLKNFADGSAIRPYHLEMERNVAIIGAGVSGLTCGVVLAEHGYRTAIFAKDIGQQTTSSVAAAVWFPYHVEPAERVIPLALDSYQVLVDLARFPRSGVSIIESRQFLRTGEIEIPDWAIPLGGSAIPSEVENGAAGEAATWTGRPEAERTESERIKSRRAGFNVSPRDPSTPPARAGSAHDEHCFASGFSLPVPLMDTTIYLDYLTARFGEASGEIHANVRFK